MKKNKTLRDVLSQKKKPIIMACGFEPSVMDGTEHTINVDDKLQLPDEFSWENNMPPVRNQGNSTTCVCQSLTGMLDFYYNAEKDTPNKCNNFSIEELYGARENKRAGGMSIKEALRYLRHTGLNKYKISGYARLMTPSEMQHALVMFGPCIAGFPCYNQDPQHFWRKGGTYFGGHAITIVGYTKTGFIVRNSWGTNWGTNGYNEIPYKDYPGACIEAWTFTI